MTTFDEREKEFEARFKHDENFRFKVKARRNRLLGLWAAERMGLSSTAAASYAKGVIAAEFEHGGDKHVVDKVIADLAAEGHAATAEQVKFELTHFADRARNQLMAE
jgi:hypothetical protein